MKIWNWLKCARFTVGKRAGTGSWKPPIITSQSSRHPFWGEGRGLHSPTHPSTLWSDTPLLLPTCAPWCMLSPQTYIRWTAKCLDLFVYWLCKAHFWNQVLSCYWNGFFFFFFPYSLFLLSSPESCKIVFVKHRGMKQGALWKKSLPRNE